MTFGNIILHPPEDKIGFVYKITDNTGLSYIGCKTFYSKVTRPPLKGKKNKRRSIKESDWKTYTSSGTWSERIKIKPEQFTFEILDLCETKTDMAAREAYHQLKYYVDGRWNELSNEMINLRVRIRKIND